MKEEKKVKFPSNISIMFLYGNKSRLLGFFENLKEKIYEYNSFCYLDNLKIPDKKSNIYFIQVDSIDKKIFKYIQEIHKKYTSSHIYIFTKYHTNANLLKLALNLGIKNVFDIDIDESLFVNHIYRALKKYAIDIHKTNLIYLGEQLDTTYPIFIFINNRLVYANSNAKRFLNAEKLRDLEKKIIANSELKKIIAEKNSKNYLISFEKDKNIEKYHCVTQYDDIDDKLIVNIFQRDYIFENELSKLTQNRFAFLEELKDKIVQNSLNRKSLFAVMISIENGDKLKNSYTKLEYYEFLKNFILKVDTLKENSYKIVEWNNNAFIFLQEGLTFEKMKQYCSLLHNNIIESQKENKLLPIVTTSFFSLEEKKIDSIIEFIEKACNDTLTSKESQEFQYYEYRFLDEHMDEQEQISNLLHNCINNNISVKLLNIYKGLCVNTPSKVLKYHQGFFYFSCEKLQRYIIKFDKETIIQSSIFPHDIKAIVKFIDLNKEYIILEKFHFLKDSINNRRYTRVQPTVRTPITLEIGNSTNFGELIDLSISSIAVKIKKDIDKSLEGSLAHISFKLPNKHSEEGFSIVNLNVKVYMIIQMEGYVKIVLNINEEDTDAYIMQYIYERQRELVEELKKAVKVMS